MPTELYRLSPLQQAMLQESVASPAGAWPGVWRWVWTLPQALDLAAFERAWGRVVERHPIFRTRLLWAGLAEPCQEVVPEARLPFESRSFLGLPRERWAERLASWLAEDLQRGLPLDQAPLLRVTAIRFAPDHHEIVVTLHHATFDGRTLLAFVPEVFAFYDAFCRGEELTLPAVRPYRLYVDWLEQQDRERARDFWRETLAGLGEPTPLAVDRAAAPPKVPDAPEDPDPLGQLSTWLPEAETAALAALARRNGLTLNTLLLAAWTLVLGRYSGRRDLLFGVVRTHRGALGDDPVILGPVMVSVPFRGRVEPAARLDRWLAGLRANWTALRTGDFLPLAEIRAESELPPEAPLYESLVLFETHELTARLRQNGGDWSGRSFRLVRRKGMPLSLYGYLERRLALKVIYDRDRFDRTTIERLLGHLTTALLAMPAGEEQSVSMLPLLGPAERHQLLVEWNDTALPGPPGLPGSPVHLRFAALARRAPEALAVADPAASRTYGELDREADRLARLLAARGVGPGSIVGVGLGRSWREVAALLAVLKAGAAYLPCDPELPAERLGAILADAGASLLVTDSALAPRLDPATPLLCLDRLEKEPPVPTVEPVAPSISPLAPAYVIYTSGSTGRPKGVVVSHQGLANLVDWHVQAFGVGPGDRASRIAGQGFDAAVWELWPYLATGAAVLHPDEETRLAPAGLRDWLVGEGVTIGFAPTPMAELLLDLDWPAGTALRLLLTGGDALRRRPPAGLPFELVNDYGPTEGSVVATSGRVAAGDPGSVGSCGPAPSGAPRSQSQVLGAQRSQDAPSLGRPVGNARVDLLSDEGEPVPIGARGEICLGGAGLAQGYLGRPGPTAENFVPDPFAGSGARRYRTGDLARRLPDGEVEFLGRRDFQVKVRGVRIEPGEIEAALAAHPAVQAAAVTVLEAEVRTLAAFVVARTGAALDEAELRGFLGRLLPRAMIPSLVFPLAALPLTANGKVDRRALAALALSATATTAASPRGHVRVPPGTALEKLVVQLWGEVLGREEPGIEDDFFALGGQSLAGVQVVAFLRDLLGCDLSLDLLFREPTVARLLAALFPSPPARARAERIAELALDAALAEPALAEVGAGAWTEGPA
ncbi:MAG TPA: amino acid adenylation domain-containing protein [Thermoanaerobaculia bacterium]|nr:amino acid adenylation domain-containing protein [Thermoanaerobaculia bacterium]